mgnify:CR=1 FL=1
MTRRTLARLILLTLLPPIPYLLFMSTCIKCAKSAKRMCWANEVSNWLMRYRSHSDSSGSTPLDRKKVISRPRILQERSAIATYRTSLAGKRGSTKLTTLWLFRLAHIMFITTNCSKFISRELRVTETAIIMILSCRSWF